MVEREAFIMKPKHQCYLSQWVTRVYGIQSWKEKIKEWMLSNFVHELGFKGYWWKKKLFLQNQSTNIVHLSNENMFMMPNNKKKGDYYKNPCLSHLTNVLDSKENGGRSFSCETKAWILCAPMMRTCLWCPTTKRKDSRMHVLLFHKQTLSQRKFMEKNLFLQNQSSNILYPNKENMFIVPKNKRKRDY